MPNIYNIYNIYKFRASKFINIINIINIEFITFINLIATGSWECQILKISIYSIATEPRECQIFIECNQFPRDPGNAKYV